MTRGLGQLTEALAFGYDKAALVTLLKKLRKSILLRYRFESLFEVIGLDLKLAKISSSEHSILIEI